MQFTPQIQRISANLSIYIRNFQQLLLAPASPEHMLRSTRLSHFIPRNRPQLRCHIEPVASVHHVSKSDTISNPLQEGRLLFAEVRLYIRRVIDVSLKKCRFFTCGLI